MGRRLAELTWPETGSGSLLVVATGSCEQHGPHLPFDTDTRIAEALVAGLARRFAQVTVAPSLGISASGEHQSFPGTLSLGSEVFADVVVELCRSALPVGQAAPGPFNGVLFVNGHGGNVAAFSHACELLRSEGRDVRAWHPVVPGGDSHAGATETSLMLHLCPDRVRTDRLEVGSTRRWREIGALVMEQGLAAVTHNGILGDPRSATAAEGARLFATLLDDLCAAAVGWFPSLVEATGDATDDVS